MSRYRIMALDQATQTGWACGDQDSFERKEVDSGVFRMPKRPTLGQRLLCFEEGLIERLKHFEEAGDPVEIIAYEEPYWPHQQASSGGVDLGLALSTLNKCAKGELSLGQAQQHLRHNASNKDAGPHISADTLRFLQKVAAVVELTGARLGISTECYPPSTWRKSALGYGRAPPGSPSDHMKKAMVQKARQLGYDVGSEDEAEAIGILLHALHGKAANDRGQGDLLELAQSRLRP